MQNLTDHNIFSMKFKIIHFNLIPKLNMKRSFSDIYQVSKVYLQCTYIAITLKNRPTTCN